MNMTQPEFARFVLSESESAARLIESARDQSSMTGIANGHALKPSPKHSKDIAPTFLLFRWRASTSCRSTTARSSNRHHRAAALHRPPARAVSGHALTQRGQRPRRQEQVAQHQCAGRYSRWRGQQHHHRPGWYHRGLGVVRQKWPGPGPLPQRYVGLIYTTVKSDHLIPQGEQQVRMECACDGNRAGRGGTATLHVDGQARPGSMRMERSHLSSLNFDETNDLGRDTGAPGAGGHDSPVGWRSSPCWLLSAGVPGSDVAEIDVGQDDAVRTATSPR